MVVSTPNGRATPGQFVILNYIAIFTSERKAKYSNGACKGGLISRSALLPQLPLNRVFGLAFGVTIEISNKLARAG